MTEPKLDILAVRRSVLAAPLALFAAGILDARAAPVTMGRFGLAARLTAKPGCEAEVRRLLIGLGNAPGCLFFSTSADAAKPRVFWTVEFWADAASQDRALQMPGPKATIASIQPLLASYEPVARFDPIVLEAGGRSI